MSDYFSHETAIISPEAQIGPRTKIWHFCHIQGAASIGNDCTLGQNVFVGKNAIIGNMVKIQNNVSVYDRVIMQDNVFCGPSVVFTNVIAPRAFISQKENFSQTLVKYGATLGANSTILCGKTIGRFAFIGAGAVVTNDVKDFALVKGNPARQSGWVGRNAEPLDLPLSGNGECISLNVLYRLNQGVVSDHEI